MNSGRVFQNTTYKNRNDEKRKPRISTFYGFGYCVLCLPGSSQFIRNQSRTVRSGFRKARLIIWMGFLMNFMVVGMGQIAVALPAAPFWEGEEGFNFVFGMAPRIAAASLTAFLVGSFINAYVMSKMKVASHGKNFSARAILSTIAGESADSLIFFPLAFGGLMPVSELAKMMLVQVILKTLYEVIILPVTIRVVNYIKRVDDSDVYDEHISYNVLKIKEI